MIPVNITEKVIEGGDTFNTKWCPYELGFGYFNDQPIPSNYYNFINDENDDGNNIPINPIEDALPDNEGVEDSVVPNDEDINNEIIIDDDSRLVSDIDPLQNKVL